MQVESGQDQISLVASRTCPQPLSKISIVKGDSVAAAVSKSGVEILRVFPAPQKIFELTSLELGADVSPLDLAIDREGKTLFVSTSKPKVFSTSLEESVGDKKQSVIFADARTPIARLSCTGTGTFFDNVLNPFKQSSPESEFPNLLDRHFQCSFAHIFALKENLNRVQNLESAFKQGQEVAFFSGLEDFATLRVSLQGVTDFFRLNLRNLCDIGEFANADYCFSASLDELLVASADDGAESVKLSLVSLDFLHSHMKESLGINYNLVFCKEILTNLKLGFFAAKNALGDISKRLKSYLEDLNLETEEGAKNLSSYIRLGSRKFAAIGKFLEDLDFRKLNELHDSICASYLTVLDFLNETFIPGMRRISVHFEFAKRIMEVIGTREHPFFCKENVSKFEHLLVLIQKAVAMAVERLIDKKISLKNFFLYLCKCRMKQSSIQLDSYNKQFLESTVDFSLLIEHIKTPESIFLEDAIKLMDTFPLVTDDEPSHEPSSSDFLAQVSQELGIVIEKTEEAIPSNDKGLLANIRELDGVFVHIFEEFSQRLASKAFVRYHREFEVPGGVLSFETKRFEGSESLLSVLSESELILVKVGKQDLVKEIRVALPKPLQVFNFDPSTKKLCFVFRNESSLYAIELTEEDLAKEKLILSQSKAKRFDLGSKEIGAIASNQAGLTAISAYKKLMFFQ